MYLRVCGYCPQSIKFNTFFSCRSLTFSSNYILSHIFLVLFDYYSYYLRQPNRIYRFASAKRISILLSCTHDQTDWRLLFTLAVRTSSAPFLASLRVSFVPSRPRPRKRSRIFSTFSSERRGSCVSPSPPRRFCGSRNPSRFNHIYIYECIYVIKFILIKNPVRIDATSYTYYNVYTYTHVVYVQVNSLINLNEAAVKSLSVLRASPRSLLLRTLKYNAHANVSRFSYTSLTTS